MFGGRGERCTRRRCTCYCTSFFAGEKIKIQKKEATCSRSHTQPSVPTGSWRRFIIVRVRGLTASAGVTVFTSILRRRVSNPGLGVRGVCVCVICAPVSVGVCGWGEGSGIPHTAVLSPPSLLSILCAELHPLLALNLLWGRGRDSPSFPRSSLQLGTAPLRLALSLGLSGREGEHELVSPPLAGDWPVGGWGRARG